MTALKIALAPGLNLPLSAVTEPIGIFANRGKGKSSTARRFVEQLYRVGLPSVVFDIKGDWYGIRSSADGRGAGLPFLIFGGDHGDVPLEPGSGPVVARFLAEHRVPAIIDLSHFSKTKARQWVMECAETLYAVNREPLMVVVDEADVLIPQRLAAELMRLLGAMEDIAKRGRQRGLGLTIISQRVQDVNKSVTELLETLLLFAITGTRMRKAILEWIDDHADPEQAKAVIATLSTLDRGECWVWSPGFLKILDRVQISMFETFDTFKTPEPGEARRVPRTMADVDLGKLTAEIQETVERAKADDPKELRRRITELERQLRDQPAPEPVRVEVPVLSDTDRAIVDTFRATVDAAAEQWTEVTRSVTMLAERIGAHDGRPDLPRTRPPGDAAHQVGAGRRAAQRPDPPVRREPSRPAVPRATPTHDVAAGDAALGKTERIILAVLVQHGARDHRQLALQSGYSAKASTIRVALGKLRRLGYVEPNAPIRATAAGVDALGDFKPLPTGRALLDYWRGQLDGTSTNVLDAMLGFYPNDTTKDEIADATGYSPDASTIRVALGKLRRLELVDGWRISDDFARSIGLA